MIELKLRGPVPDKHAKTFMQACQMLFGCERDGFQILWDSPDTLHIYQSETKVSIKRDSRKES